MTDKTKHILAFISAGVTALLIIILCLITFNYNGSDECTAASVVIEDADERQYVSERDVLHYIRQHGLHPVGKVFDSVNCEEIERTLLKYEPIRTAECYKTSGGEIRIIVSQRLPILRIITATESYFIDSDRKRMSILPTIKANVLTAEGTIGEQMAKTDIADFAEWLMNDNYWQGRITRMAVRSDKNTVLYQNNNEPRIALGKINNYKRKLKRLRIFMEAKEDMDIKNYKELDVSIDGQVIGRN